MIITSCWHAKDGVSDANKIIDEGIKQIKIDTDRMTPSYTNAFVFTLMENLNFDELELDIQSDRIYYKISKSKERYNSGIRLTTQR